MKLKYLLAGLVCCFSIGTLAAPAVLTIDKKVKPRKSEKYIYWVHQEIQSPSDNLYAIKHAILQGMLMTRGYKWLYEGEGDGYILARFDYRGDTNIVRIEYDEDMVQLKYHSAWGDFKCTKLVDGICYHNRTGYYKYIRNLRTSIAQQIAAL